VREICRYISRLHWIAIWLPTALGLLPLLIICPALFSELPQSLLPPVATLSYSATVIFGLARVNQERLKIVVTDLGIIVAKGLIRRSMLEISLHQVDYVHVHQSLLGRVLDYGDVTICGASGREERMNSIANPLAFQRCVTALIRR
jgi:uncharacterized membrane protein YdbT with pleckstrin-like domain